MHFLLVHFFFTARFWRLLHCLLAGGTLAAWVGGIGMLVWNRKRYRSLSAVPFHPSEIVTLPSLSILVPACNEAATVERAMQSLLALDYPCLEIIAIDDRSTDETGAILDRMAARHPRLRVLHIADLPSGWLGKNHAMHVASEVAAGDWLLFTDADVVYRRDALCRAVAYAQRQSVDHLVVSPHIETRGFWERLFVSYFALMFSFRTRPWDVSNPKKSAYTGFGAFNMVRTAAYRRFGGHGALPMEVADDTKLGKIIKRNGFRTELLEGSDLMSVRWMIGFQGVLDSLTKNAFAGFDFNLVSMLGALLGIAITGLYPVVALLLPFWPARLPAAGCLLAMVWGASVIRRVSDTRACYGLAYPLASLLLIYIILRSTWRAYRQNGILWRGTLYPLKELRKGVV
jgi:glycosyltransferase involved in cell wall biosynthesis